MNYRPEVDGMRAIAVLPVILFHAGIEAFAGGFIGVDIFFVISGYLITTILINELESDRFSIARFYERRARRILPALLVVILLCIPAAWVTMRPSQLEEFGWNIGAVTLFLSNISLWLNTDYFAASADLNPLLHTWSLAVEEQFYIFFPPLLWLLWKAGRRYSFAAIVALSAISLGLAEWGWRNVPDANFYLLPFRAWELGAGSICAYLLRHRELAANDALSFAGLLLIGFSVLTYDASTPFPSLWALAPVVGTALVILYTTQHSVVGRILALKPLVHIGLLSYSAYLWHQPLFAFARLSGSTEPSLLLMLALSVLSIGLAHLTWRFIENPFRSQHRKPPRALPTRRALFSGSALALSAFLGAGILLYASGGAPGRATTSGVSYAALDIDSRMQPNYGLDSACRDVSFSELCQSGPDPRILLWGDSYAMHLAPGLLSSPDAPSFAQITKSACGPFMDLSIIGSGRFDARFAKECIRFNDEVIDFIQKNDIELVIASSAMRPAIRKLYTRDGSVLPAGSHDVALNGMRRTAELVRAAGAQIVWVTPPPSNGSDLSKCAIEAAMTSSLDSTACQFSIDDAATAAERENKLLDAAKSFMPVFPLSDLLCSEGACATVLEGSILYRDDGHLSVEGAATLGKTFNLMSQIRTAARSSNRSAAPLRDTEDLISRAVARAVLPEASSFSFQYEVLQDRIFSADTGALRRGLMLGVIDKNANDVFSQVERDLQRRGYSLTSAPRRNRSGRVSQFFANEGGARLYVRSSPVSSARSEYGSHLWISWDI